METKEKPTTPIGIIIEELGMTQTEFAENINYGLSVVNRVVKGKRGSTIDMLLAINTKYGYSIDFMLGRSDEKMDEARSILKALGDIFTEITTTPKSYIDNEGKEVNGNFIRLSINESLYKFLVENDHAQKLEKMGLESYVEEVEKIKRRFIKDRKESKSIDCVLIPSNQLIEIIDFNKYAQTAMDEILSFSDERDYFSEEDIEEIRNNLSKKDIEKIGNNETCPESS